MKRITGLQLFVLLHIALVPATPRSLLRDAYKAPEIEGAPKKRYLVQKPQRFRLTLANKEGVLKLLLSLLSLTDPIKIVSEIRRDDGKIGQKILTVSPVYASEIRGNGILKANDPKRRSPRHLEDQQVRL